MRLVCTDNGLLKGISTMLLALLFCISGQGLEKVGRLGEPDALIVEGVAAFSKDAVKSALLTDLDVALAGYPHANRSEYLKVLAERTECGYRREAYFLARARAEIDPDGKHVRLHIVEGKHLKAGPVRVVGVDRVR